MAWLVLFICVLIVASVLAFLKYPPPELSHRLKAWKKSGRYLRFQNKLIFYKDERGSGRTGTLVCLHGFPTCSFDWIKVLPKLREEFSSIIMVDFLGFGFSDKPSDCEYTISMQADIVEDLVEKLGISEVHILSHDYGDTVALELLARFNNKESKLILKSLTMLNGGIFPETHHPRPAQKLLLMPFVGYLASRLYSYRAFCRGFGEIFGSNKPTEEDYKDFWASLRYNDGDKASYKVINFLRERKAFKKRWVGALKESTVKVLMIYGPADPVNPLEFAQHFKQTVGQHQLVKLNESVGHYPQWEDPDRVAEEFVCFISRL